MTWTNDKGKAVAALSEEKHAAEIAAFEAEKAEVDAAFAEWFEANGVDVLLTPCTVVPPRDLRREGFQPLLTALAEAGAAGDMAKISAASRPSNAFLTHS